MSLCATKLLYYLNFLKKVALFGKGQECQVTANVNWSMLCFIRFNESKIFQYSVKVLGL